MEQCVPVCSSILIGPPVVEHLVEFSAEPIHGSKNIFVVLDPTYVVGPGAALQVKIRLLVPYLGNSFVGRSRPPFCNAPKTRH